MSYWMRAPFSWTWSAQIVRPFFKWMTSAWAHTAPASKIANRRVTDSRTMAHSSNRGKGSVGDKGNAAHAPDGLCRRISAGHQHDLCGSSGVARPSETGTAESGGSLVPAATKRRTRQVAGVPGTRRLV